MAKKYLQFGILTTAVTYLLIFAGGLVRISGAGLGCPDWPKCFGRWIPPTNLNQLPPHIDPGSFNLTLAWIEYSNRLLGAVTGILVLILAVWAFKFLKQSRGIPVTAALVLVLTGMNGWLGKVVVESLLKPHVVTLHMLLALAMVSVLLINVKMTSLLVYPDQEKNSDYLPGLKRWTALAIGLLLVEILIGTELRAGLEVISANHPIAGAASWIRSLGPIKYFHTAIGLLLAATVYLIYRYILKSKAPSPAVKFIGTAILILTILQILLGDLMVFVHFSGLARLQHMWIAAVVWGLLIITYQRLEFARIGKNS